MSKSKYAFMLILFFGILYPLLVSPADAAQSLECARIGHVPYVCQKERLD